MRATISPARLIVFLVLLAPFINNVNGFLKWKAGLSVIGPAFYSFLFTVLALILLSPRPDASDKAKNYAMLALIGFLFVVHIPISGLRDDYPGYVKAFLPVLLLRFLRQYWTGPREPISGWLEWATIIWAGFASITAALHIRPAAGEGYYGFVHGNNDYVVMLFAIFPLTTGWRHKLPIAAYYLALVLTRSKGLVALAPMMLLIPRSNKARFALLGFVAVMLFLTISYYVRYFQNNFGPGYALTPMNLIAFISFGRLNYLFRLFENMGDKTWIEHLIGSGYYGGLEYLEGKVGIEMDPFDAYNVFGIVGLALSAWFYYWQVLAMKGQSWRTKVKFLPMIGYSIAGGHLFNNPMSNLVLVLVIFILEGRRTVDRPSAGPGNPPESPYTNPGTPTPAAPG